MESANPDNTWGGGVLSMCMAVVVWPWTLAFLQCRDGARRVFTNQVPAPSAKRREVFGEAYEG